MSSGSSLPRRAALAAIASGGVSPRSSHASAHPWSRGAGLPSKLRLIDGEDRRVRASAWGTGFSILRVGGLWCTPCVAERRGLRLGGSRRAGAADRRRGAGRHGGPSVRTGTGQCATARAPSRWASPPRSGRASRAAAASGAAQARARDGVASESLSRHSCARRRESCPTRRRTGALMSRLPCPVPAVRSSGERCCRRPRAWLRAARRSRAEAESGPLL
jgi:hypothetical protein